MSLFLFSSLNIDDTKARATAECSVGTIRQVLEAPLMSATIDGSRISYQTNDQNHSSYPLNQNSGELETNANTNVQSSDVQNITGQTNG